MQPLPKIHTSVLDAVQNPTPLVSQIIREDASPPFNVKEPTSLKFLEELAGFHVGDIPGPTRARTSHFYSLLASRFLGILKSLEIVLRHLTRDDIASNTYYNVEQRYLHALYHGFGVRTTYPVYNLILLVLTYIPASCCRTLLSNPVPRFQSFFFAALPIDVIRVVVSFVPDTDILALAQTCYGLWEICDETHRLHRKLFFHLRYNSLSVHFPYPSAQDMLHVEILEQMINTRLQMTSNMKAAFSGAASVRNIRYLSFDNEWEHMWPPHVPSYLLVPTATDREVFEPLYNSIMTHVDDLPVQHVRLVSLAVSDRFLSRITNHPTLTRLTVARYTCFTAFEVPRIGPQAMKIMYLAIGFHGSFYTHRSQWRLLGAFPALRQLFAYTTDVSDTPIRFPIVYADLFHIHKLEILHVQGASVEISDLTAWLSFAATMTEGPGALRQLKLHARGAIDCADARRLLTVLATHHPSLRILVLEGLDRIFPDFVGAIASDFRDLESLSLVRRANSAQKSNKICEWNDSIYKYAEAMRACQKIRHLEINTLSPVTIYSPRLLHVLYKSLHGQWPSEYPRDRWEREPEDIPSDVTSIALPFATHCPSLTSFAIRAGTCFFSCSIRRRADGRIAFSDVRSVEKHSRFENWNPDPETTWNYDP